MFDHVDRLSRAVRDSLLDPSAKYTYAVVLLSCGFILWCPLAYRIPSLGMFQTTRWVPRIAVLFLASVFLLVMSLSYELFSWRRRRRKEPLVHRTPPSGGPRD
jgi:hypothetical protein